MDYAAEKARQREASRAMRANAKTSPLRSSGGGGFEPSTAQKPSEARGLAARGFSDAEIRALHNAASGPRTERREFGVGYGD